MPSQLSAAPGGGRGGGEPKWLEPKWLLSQVSDMLPLGSPESVPRLRRPAHRSDIPTYAPHKNEELLGPPQAAAAAGSDRFGMTSPSGLSAQGLESPWKGAQCMQVAKWVQGVAMLFSQGLAALACTDQGIGPSSCALHMKLVPLACTMGVGTPDKTCAGDVRN